MAKVRPMFDTFQLFSSLRQTLRENRFSLGRAKRPHTHPADNRVDQAALVCAAIGV
jgi:hypothetical protein